MKTLGLGTGLIMLVAASALLDQETGVATWLVLRDSLNASDARVAELEQSNAALRRDIEMLETESSGHDRAIREELDLVLPGESIVYFTRDGASQSELRLRSGRVWAPSTREPGIRSAEWNQGRESSRDGLETR